MKYRDTRPCDKCNRPVCASEHLTIDISPAAMSVIQDMLEVQLLREQANISLTSKTRLEVHNFASVLRSLCLRWQDKATPPSQLSLENSDLI